MSSRYCVVNSCTQGAYLHLLLKDVHAWPPSNTLYWATYTGDNVLGNVVRLGDAGVHHRFTIHTDIDGTNFGVSYQHGKSTTFIMAGSIYSRRMIEVLYPETMLVKFEKHFVSKNYKRRGVKVNVRTMELRNKGQIYHKNDVSPKTYHKISVALSLLGIQTDIRTHLLKMIREEPPTDVENGDRADVEPSVVGKRSRQCAGHSTQRTRTPNPSESGDGSDGKRRRLAVCKG